MKLRSTLAAVSAISLAAGGLMLGSTVAAAAGGNPEYVPEPIRTADQADETANYNEWHFSPGRNGAESRVNGLLVPAGGDILALKGNANDELPADPANDGAYDIEEFANSLTVVSSDNSRVFFQVPVFYGYDENRENPKFTTLRKAASDTGNLWVSSRPITDATATQVIPANTATDLGDIVDALPEDARPIAAGLNVFKPASPVLVSSFTVGEAETKFYQEPTPTGIELDRNLTFVTADEIAADESEYEGWHQGVDPAIAGTFETIAGENQSVLGLNVTGKSQLLKGFAEADRLQNNLAEIVEAGVQVALEPGDDAAGIALQVPVFIYPEGSIDPVFTTLRTDIPADGVITADAIWTTSRAFGDFAANGTGTLGQFLAFMPIYQILGYGIHVEAGSVLLKGIQFAGEITPFALPPVQPGGTDVPDNGGVKNPDPVATKPPVKEALPNTGAEGLPMVGFAALALLLAGAGLLAMRRLQR